MTPCGRRRSRGRAHRRFEDVEGPLLDDGPQGIDAGVVLDDLLPCEQWPPLTYGKVDALRERWLTDERFTAVEVMVAPGTAVLIATRR